MRCIPHLKRERFNFVGFRDEISNCEWLSIGISGVFDSAEPAEHGFDISFSELLFCRSISGFAEVQLQRILEEGLGYLNRRLRREDFRIVIKQPPILEDREPTRVIDVCMGEKDRIDIVGRKPTQIRELVTSAL
jgi:hypothetical protein